MNSTTDIPLKRCTKCDTEYPATLEYFVKDTARKSGMAARCRECDRRMCKERYEQTRQDPEKMAKRRQHSLNYLHKAKANPEKRARIRQIDNERKRWEHANNTPYAQRRNARRRAGYREKSQDPEWHQRENERKAEYRNRMRHDPAWMAKQREAVRRWQQTVKGYATRTAYRKRYYASPKGRMVIINISRRYSASKRNLPATLMVEQWRACLDYFGHCCAVCGRPRGLWHTLAQDHWIPLTHPDCPGTVALNIVPLCHGDGGCNNSKKNHPAHEWLSKRHSKRKNAVLKRIADYFEWVKQQA